MSHRTQRALSGLFSSSAGSIALQIANILIIPVYLDFTSQELFGLWLTLAACLAWAKIGDLGLGLSLTRESVEAVETSNKNQLSKLISSAATGTLMFGALVSTIAFFHSDLIASVLSIPGHLFDEYENTFRILLIVAIIRPTFALFSSVIEAYQHIGFLHFKNTSISLVTILCTVLFLALDFGVEAFAYALLIESLLLLTVDFMYLKVSEINYRYIPCLPNPKLLWSLLGFGSKFQLLKISNLVVTNVPHLVIASYMGLSFVAIYSFTGKLAQVAGLFFASLIPVVLFSGMSQLFAQASYEKLKSVYFILSNFSLRLGVLSAVTIFLVNERFVGVWVGNENYDGLMLTTGFCLWVFIESAIRGVTAVILSSTKISGLTLISVLEAVFNLICSIIFIQLFGLVGVIFGSLVSRLISFVYVPYAINCLLAVPQNSYVRFYLKNLIWHVSSIFFGAGCVFLLVPQNTPTIPYIVASVATLFLINIAMNEGVAVMKLRGTLKERLRALRSLYLVA